MANQNKKTLVMGASENPDRYSNKAIQRLRANGHEVVAIGRRKGKVGTVDIETGLPAYTDIDTVTMYLNASNQKEFYSYILSLSPKRIVFNPGAENPELMEKAETMGITCENACTLVLLSTNVY